MSKGLMTSSRTSTKSYHKCMNKLRTDPAYLNYIKYRKVYNTLKRTPKINYYSQLFKDYKFDIRNTWKTIRTLIGGVNDKTIVTQTFTLNNETISDGKVIASKFCNFFATIRHKYGNKIPLPSYPYNHYLTKKKNRNTFFINSTDPCEISELIKSLKPKKSCSSDNLSSILLKLISKNYIIVNKSIECGKVPDLMKTAKVIPIFKSKAKDDLSNYRPISILPTISKILEKVVHKRLYQFIKKSNIIYQNQYGFRHNHSTLHAVTKLVSDLVHNMDNKKPTLSVFLDLSKAFDTIDHDILLCKLDFYGIRGLALDWFKSYLYNRKQYVSYNGVQSESLSINCGVPQGSVLGPLLFIIYTNDLPDLFPRLQPYYMQMIQLYMNQLLI